MKGLDYLYIDYENVQDIKVDVIKKVANVKIILGQDQNKVPIELVQRTQPLGDAVEWIQVNGRGRNALDFFIAFFLGRDIALNKDKAFIIYSKDTGYDPLINYLKKNGVKIKRIVSFNELDHTEDMNIDESYIKKVKDSLIKVANRRPKKRKTLNGFVNSIFKGNSQIHIDDIIEELFIRKIVYEENGIIKYSLGK